MPSPNQPRHQHRHLPLHPSFQTTGRIFFDYGKVHRKSDSAARAAGINATESLSGAGLGITAVFARRYTLELEGVMPVDNHDASDGRDDGRVWAQVSTTF